MPNTDLVLKNMTNTVNSLNSLLSVIRETEENGEVYLIVEHKDYGHVTELHVEDYPYHKEILRDALEFAINDQVKEALPPWD